MFQQSHGAFMAGRARYEPMIKLSSAIMPNQFIAHEPGSFRMFEAGVDANAVFAVSPDNFVKLGLYGNARHYQFTSSSRLADETIYAAGVKVGFGWFLSEDVLLEIEARPGVFSDLDGSLKHNDYDVPSHALFTFRGTSSFYWKLGVRYNQIFADAPWLPYLGMSWDITGTVMPPGETSDAGAWRLDVLLPEYAELSYWMTGSTAFSLGAQIQGAEYHVRTSSVSGRQRDNLRVQEVQAYLGMTHRFNDMFSFMVQAGANVAGQYDLTNGATGFQHVDGALGQGFFATASIGFDF
ncbi:MAG: DUF6268 family outer membrane beta-barrel protein [Planctomycetota bacterium]